MSGTAVSVLSGVESPHELCRHQRHIEAKEEVFYRFDTKPQAAPGNGQEQFTKFFHS